MTIPKRIDVLHTGLYSNAAYLLLEKAVDDMIRQKDHGIFNHAIPLQPFHSPQLRQLCPTALSQWYVHIGCDGELFIKAIYEQEDAKNPKRKLSMQKLRNALRRLGDTNPDNMFSYRYKTFYNKWLECSANLNVSLKEACEFLYDFLKVGSIDKLMHGKNKYDIDFARKMIGVPIDPFRQFIFQECADDLQKFVKMSILEIKCKFNKPHENVMDNVREYIDERKNKMFSLLQ